MFSECIKREQQQRRPEDSGEWHPVPRPYRWLPKPDIGLRIDGASENDTRLNRTAQLLPLFQCVLGLAIFFIAGGTNNGAELLLVVPMVTGFLSAMMATFYAMAHHNYSVSILLDRMIRGQLWWGLLLLIPCYGWAMLIVCVPLCAIGTILGNILASALSRIEKPEVKQWSS